MKVNRPAHHVQKLKTKRKLKGILYGDSFNAIAIEKNKIKGVSERGRFPSLCISISTAIVIDLMTKTRGTDPSEFQDPADLYQIPRAYRGKGTWA